jgi:hypothetical protein
MRACISRRWTNGKLDTNQDTARQAIVNWINGAGNEPMAFDFPTKVFLEVYH